MSVGKIALAKTTASQGQKMCSGVFFSEKYTINAVTDVKESVIAKTRSRKTFVHLANSLS